MRQPFDEAHAMDVLVRASPQTRTAFAAAITATLLPSYESLWFELSSSTPCREALAISWDFSQGRVIALNAQLEDALAELYPSEDEGEFFRMVIGQNAIGAALHAIRSTHMDGAQEAVWAGRQLHDAADSAAGGPYENRSANAICQYSFGVLEDALLLVEEGSVEELHGRSRLWGLGFREQLDHIMAERPDHSG